MTNYEIHPAAALFPMIGEAELWELANGIKANGLLEPIELYEGKVLDGRNRLAACKLVGVEPKFVALNGECKSAVHYVISKNLHRRHLTVSQRAAIAADMIPMLADEAKQRQLSHLKNQPHVSFRPIGGNEHGEAREIAAGMLGVGATTVSKAVRAKRDNPEGFEKVKAGELTVNAAAEGLTVQPERTHLPKDQTSKRGEVIANAEKRRMVAGLSNITGVCRGLAELNIEKVCSVTDAHEIKTWVEKARQCANSLRGFATSLNNGGK